MPNPNAATINLAFSTFVENNNTPPTTGAPGGNYCVTSSLAFGTADPGDTNNASLLLVGKAPVEVASIWVNGVSNAVTWTSVTNWSISRTLTNGANPLSVQGYGRTNNLLSGLSNSITITYQP